MKRKQQRGVALILALMVFAIISGVAVKVLTSVDRTMDIAEFSQQNVAQKETLLGGEAWAMAWLASLSTAQGSLAVIDWNAPWHLVHQVFPLDGDDRQLEIQIIERQSCINVNALTNEEFREVTRQRLQAVSNELSLSGEWIDYMTDWIDDDQSWSGNSSREDEYYLGMDPPYRTGDTPLASVSELVLLRLDDEILSSLAPYICALPNDIGINVNRLSSVMIRALFPDLDSEEREQLESTIHTSGFNDVDDFLALESLEASNLVESDWRTDIRFVDVYVTLIEQGTRRYLYSQLAKSDFGSVIPVTRSFTDFDVISQGLLMERETN